MNRKPKVAREVDEKEEINLKNLDSLIPSKSNKWNKTTYVIFPISVAH